MLRTFLAFALVFVAALHSFGQMGEGDSNGGSSFKDRIYVGGGGSLGGGTDPLYGYRYFNITVSPLVGYKITNNWSAGLGVSYTYLNYPDQRFSVSQYGASPFTRYNFGQVFAYAEYSMISVSALDNSNSRRTLSRLPVGLGYTLPLGRKASLNAVGLYDLLYDKRDGAFASPFILRVFISGGF
jgi:hypothetical protein